MTRPRDAPSPLEIDVISDVVCPWCYLGKRRLDQALELTPGLQASGPLEALQAGPDHPA